MGIAGAVYATIFTYLWLLEIDGSRDAINAFLGTNLRKTDSFRGGWEIFDFDGRRGVEKITLFSILFCCLQMFFFVAIDVPILAGMAGKYTYGKRMEIPYSIVYVVSYTVLPYLAYSMTEGSGAIQAGVFGLLIVLQMIAHARWDYGDGLFSGMNTIGKEPVKIDMKAFAKKMVFRLIGFYFIPWYFAHMYAEWYSAASSGMSKAEKKAYRNAGFRNGWIVGSVLVRTWVLSTDALGSMRENLGIRRYDAKEAAAESSPGFFGGILAKVEGLVKDKIQEFSEKAAQVAGPAMAAANSLAAANDKLVTDLK